MKEKVIDGRLVDDSCLFCGLHSDYCGGHAFRGYKNKEGNIETTIPKGWLVIPHLSRCEVQICPECLNKIKKAGIKC